jgi:sugar phosphate isomerase/epimerase
MPPARLAFATNAFKRTDVIAAVRAIAAIGYRGVEVMADAPHMRPDTFTDRQAGELRRVIDGEGLAVSNVNNFTGFAFDDGDTYHPTWVEPAAADRQRRIDFTRRAIELTARIGGDRLSLQPGGPYVGRDRDELDRLYAEGLGACVDTARACGVTLGVEPEPGLLIERAAQFAEFKRRHFADEPRVVMNCDIGHHYCVGEPPERVIEDHAAWIGHVHVEDIAASRVHQHLVPGDGAIDFDAVFRALDGIGYDGWITVELYPFTGGAEQVARRAFDHLRPLLRPQSPAQSPPGPEASIDPAEP